MEGASGKQQGNQLTESPVKFFASISFNHWQCYLHWFLGCTLDAFTRHSFYRSFAVSLLYIWRLEFENFSSFNATQHVLHSFSASIFKLQVHLRFVRSSPGNPSPGFAEDLWLSIEKDTIEIVARKLCQSLNEVAAISVSTIPNNARTFHGSEFRGA